MRKAGIREARQNLSELIEYVKQGQEIVITARGRPVARLVPAVHSARPFRSLASFRKTMPVLDPPLSQAVLEEREEEREDPFR